MRKLICMVAVAALICCGCGNGGKKMFMTLADFEGAKIASQTGAVFARFIDPVIPNVNHLYFSTLPEIAAAVSAGEVDAASLDMPVAKYFVAQNSDFFIFPDVVAKDRYGFAVTKGSEFGVQANRVLQRLKENGTVKELENVWFYADESEKALPTLNHREDFNGSAGTVRYGCDSTLVPMSYVGRDGKPTGFDLDVVSRIAYEMNMKVEFVPMNFDALLPSLAAGAVDMVGGSMSVTEERLKTVDFVGPYFEGGITLIIRKSRMGK